MNNLDLTPDYSESRDFFGIIRPVERGTFQTFDDTPKKRRNLARVLYGEGHGEELAELNAAGAGIYMAVNQMSRSGRKLKDLLAIECVFADFDKGIPASIAVEPTLRVQTSINPETGLVKEQWWWRLLGCLTLAQQCAIMARLVVDYGADANAKDAARVGRLPGFWHMKRSPQLVRIIGGTKERVSCADIIAAFPALPEVERPKRAVQAVAEIGSGYVRGTIRSLKQELAAAPDGERNSKLNFAAFRLAQLGCREGDIAGYLAPIAAAIGLAAEEIERTIASGIAGAHRVRKG